MPALGVNKRRNEYVHDHDHFDWVIMIMDYHVIMTIV
jgi:hypothetical protein